MEYEVYHDEHKDSENDIYAHGILLVPKENRGEIVSVLNSIRDEYSYDAAEKCGFAGSLRSETMSRLLSNQLTAASRMMQVQNTDSVEVYNVDHEMRHTKDFEPHTVIPKSKSYGIKFELMAVHGNHQDAFGSDYTESVENTMKWGLKDICHFAFDGSNPIEVSDLYMDGGDHYGREIDLDNICGSREGWRNYANFEPPEITKDIRSRDARTDESGVLVDWTDAIVGGLYNKIFNPSRKDPHGALKPLEDIEKRLRNGAVYKRSNSRWFRAVKVSETSPGSGQTQAPNFGSAELHINPKQRSLGL